MNANLSSTAPSSGKERKSLRARDRLRTARATRPAIAHPSPWYNTSCSPDVCVFEQEQAEDLEAAQRQVEAVRTDFRAFRDEAAADLKRVRDQLAESDHAFEHYKNKSAHLQQQLATRDQELAHCRQSLDYNVQQQSQLKERLAGVLADAQRLQEEMSLLREGNRQGQERLDQVLEQNALLRNMLRPPRPTPQNSAPEPWVPIG